MCCSAGKQHVHFIIGREGAESAFRNKIQLMRRKRDENSCKYCFPLLELLDFFNDGDFSRNIKSNFDEHPSQLIN